MKNTDLKQISRLMDEKFDEKLAPIQKTLSEHGKILGQHGKMLEEHGKILGSHDKRFDSIDKTLESNGKMLRTLKKDQGVMLEMLDGEQMKQRKRITGIESHLGLTSPTS